MDVCVACVTSYHNTHFLYPGLSCREVYEEILKVRSSFSDGIRHIEQQINYLTFRKIVAVNGIQQFFRRMREMMAARERELLSEANCVSDARLRILDEKFKEHQEALSNTLIFADGLMESVRTNNVKCVLQTARYAKKGLEELKVLLKNTHYVDEELAFVPPEDNLVLAVKFGGSIFSSNYGGLNPAYRNNAEQFLRANGVTVPFPGNDTSAGLLPINNAGNVLKGNGAALNGYNNRCPIPEFGWMSMIEMPVESSIGQFHSRDYRRIKKPVTVFAREGAGSGELCRPWGVCCDKNGHIVVADRSNNRIQVFRTDGSFVRMFGQQGQEEGQLNRPAGVAIDYYGRVVVTDKDNHRVQIFNMDGSFVFSFGERGQNNGKFQYPWDVDVNGQGVIVVSDTRNHRIQLFSGNGVYLKKFGYENASNMWKFFDSPRGVCFRTDDKILVTDFNNHRLYEIDVEKTPQMAKSEQFKKCELFRPQGVCCDSDGNILVADCRNNRVQVFNRAGESMGQFGTAGKEEGQFDRPSGMAITPEGKIVVVDFGNHRVQVF